MPEGYNLQQIRNLLQEGFSHEELRRLCYDLPGFWPVYDRLTLETRKAETVAYLLEYAQQPAQLDALLDFAKAHVPAGIYKKYEPYHITPTPADSAPTAGPEKTGRLFDMLISHLREPGVWEAVVAFQTDFQAASKQISIMNECKRLHNLLQDLELRYNLVVDYNYQFSSADEQALERLLMNEPILQSAINDLTEAARQTSFAAEEAYWLGLLTQAQAELQQGVGNSDETQLKAAIGHLRRVLDRGPSRIDTRLVAAAGALRLEALTEAMNTIRTALARLDSIPLREFEEGVVVLTQLNQRLTALVQDHTSWQSIDDELRQLEADPVGDGLDLKLIWSDIKRRTGSLYGHMTDPWAVSLSKAGAQLDSAFGASEPPAKIKQYFRSYRSQTGRRFRQVDNDLLALCRDLEKIGESLNRLLRFIQA